jgi:hypothetical protein
VKHPRLPMLSLILGIFACSAHRPVEASLPDESEVGPISPPPPPIADFAIKVVNGPSKLGTTLQLTNACTGRANLRPGTAQLIYSNEEMLSTFYCRPGTKTGIDFSKGTLLVLYRTQQNPTWTHRFTIARGPEDQLVVRSVFGPTPCGGMAPLKRSPMDLDARQQIFLIESHILDNVLGAGRHGPQTDFVYEVSLPVYRKCRTGIP